MADFCLRCGRALTNKESAKRGYGPGCYKKVKAEEKKLDEVQKFNEVMEEIEGQINFVDELKRKCS
ncbi:DUF6011 domain-containing protein [Tissierella praeacuta]|uniref:DUF6011 domain-containing protein n=1 Tax=Tissierella praeacuta TaxID=43131 RepID=UPI0028ACB760|nr:DUF6011 domain-containing protein [Tissierella praeacuta]